MSVDRIFEKLAGGQQPLQRLFRIEFHHRRDIFKIDPMTVAVGDHARLNDVVRRIRFPPRVLRPFAVNVAFFVDVATGDAVIFVPNRAIDRKHRFLFHEAIGEAVKQKLTAIILPGEAGGPNLLAALREFRLRVPEDLSVIAWETPQVSEYLDPPLTTFEQDFRRMAATAFDILEESLNGRPAAADVAVDYLFHERRSVAPPGMEGRYLSGKK